MNTSTDANGNLHGDSGRFGIKNQTEPENQLTESPKAQRTMESVRITYTRTGAKSSYYVFFDGVRSGIITKRGNKWVGLHTGTRAFVSGTDRDDAAKKILDLG